MIPLDTPRLHFRAMSHADISSMTALLGDPDVMRFYPAPKSHSEVVAWIDWNRANYAEHGYGLWIIETLDGVFVGDCGLTWQRVNGDLRLEVGYHVVPSWQGVGLATEAAAACRDFARETLREPELVAIVHPDNHASARVAVKLGMRESEDDQGGGLPARRVLSMLL